MRHFLHIFEYETCSKDHAVLGNITLIISWKSYLIHRVDRVRCGALLNQQYGYTENHFIINLSDALHLGINFQNIAGMFYKNSCRTKQQHNLFVFCKFRTLYSENSLIPHSNTLILHHSANSPALATHYKTPGKICYYRYSRVDSGQRSFNP